MRMKSIVEFMSEGCLSCRGNSINLWNEMEKWIELTNRQRVNEWAAVNGNEQAPPTQAPNARGKPIQLQSIILCEDDWWNWFGGVEWVVFVGGYRRLQAAGNQPTKETSQLPSSQFFIFSWIVVFFSKTWLKGEWSRNEVGQPSTQPITNCPLIQLMKSIDWRAGCSFHFIPLHSTKEKRKDICLSFLYLFIAFFSFHLWNEMKGIKRLL